MIGVVEGMQALDLFAGSGALGIEAISRGAQKAVFVERDAATLRVLRGSLADLGIAAEQADVRPEDALAALRTARKRTIWCSSTLLIVMRSTGPRSSARGSRRC